MMLQGPSFTLGFCILSFDSHVVLRVPLFFFIGMLPFSSGLMKNLDVFQSYEELTFLPVFGFGLGLLRYRREARPRTSPACSLGESHQFPRAPESCPNRPETHHVIRRYSVSD